MYGRSREQFQKVFYLSSAGVAGNSGDHPNSPLPFADLATVWAIPQYTLISRVYLIVDVAITGTTDLDVGDADDADGFIDGSLSVTLGTTGMYGWNAKTAGAYLRVQTAGATDAADIYVVPEAKFYKVSGKYVALDVTGTNTAGKARLVVEGTLFDAFGG